MGKAGHARLLRFLSGTGISGVRVVLSLFVRAAME